MTVRLTLRTLLAYLDDTLEPEDNEGLRKKIEESKFATDLVQRTRDCIRQMRLPAPPVIGRGLAADANTVAEYLDNTLPTERVADFEKICLESNKHLAEVAACHQILTLVVGEPADVDPTARERMYSVIDRADAEEPTPAAASAPAASSDTPATAAMMTETPPVTRRARPEVPEYLRESRSRFWPVAAVLVIAALITSGLLAVFSPPEWRETAANWIRGEGKDASGGPTNGNTSDASADKSAPAASLEAPKEDKPQDATANSGATDNAEMPGAGEATATAPSAAVPRGGDDVGATDKLAPSTETAAKPPALGFPKKSAADADVDNPLAPEPLDGGGPAPVVPTGKPDKTGDALPAVEKPLETPAPGPAETAGGSPLAPAPTGAPADTGPAESAGEAIGRYQSSQDVLLKYDTGLASWRRLPAKATLNATDRLLSLPAFRPTVTLINSVSVQACGPSEFVLSGTGNGGIPGVAIDYGRLTLMTNSKPGNQIRLRLTDRWGTVTFVDGESALAIEIRQVLQPGKDPETEPSMRAVEVYATSGEIRWEEGEQSVSIKAPLGRRLSPLPSEEIPATEFPKWITSDNLSTLDQRVAATIERELTPERGVLLSLGELSENRRAEVRTLAVRCSGYVGQFEPFVAALNDADQRTEWPKHIEALRADMARSPATAAQVRQAFEKHRGGEAAELYRMLWGYSPADLKDGAAAKLVEYLNHDSLDYRVLAFWNLQNLTGLTLFYQPHLPLAKRRPQYLKWKERLKDGKLLPSAATAGKTGGSAKGPRPAPTEPE